MAHYRHSGIITVTNRRSLEGVEHLLKQDLQPLRSRPGQTAAPPGRRMRRGRNGEKLGIAAGGREEVEKSLEEDVVAVEELLQVVFAGRGATLVPV